MNIIDIFLSMYFFVNLFELLYQSYDIQWELVDKPFIILVYKEIEASTKIPVFT